MGAKSPDYQIADCCYKCHQVIDGHVKTALYSHEELKLMHLEGVIRTQVRLFDDGLLEVK